MIEPVWPQEEGSTVTVDDGFDRDKVTLTGNVTGQLPLDGRLEHAGWYAQEVNLPELSDQMDPAVLMPAEIVYDIRRTFSCTDAVAKTILGGYRPGYNPLCHRISEIVQNQHLRCIGSLRWSIQGNVKAVNCCPPLFTWRQETSSRTAH